MELQLGLALSTDSRAYQPFNHKKRTFSQLMMMEHAAPPHDVMLPTLSLLPLTPSHDDDDDDDDDDHHIQFSNITKDEVEEDGVVGWPPVNYWRKKLHVEEVVGNNNIDHMVWVDHRQTHCLQGYSPNTLYVKVKMEGVGIARKVDLSMHQSFHTLKETLMDMFGKCHHQQSNNYELAYLDKEGDWLLAQDLPWRSFVGCARRLKLVKTSR